MKPTHDQLKAAADARMDSVFDQVQTEYKLREKDLPF